MIVNSAMEKTCAKKYFYQNYTKSTIKKVYFLAVRGVGSILSSVFFMVAQFKWQKDRCPTKSSAERPVGLSAELLLLPYMVLHAMTVGFTHKA